MDAGKLDTSEFEAFLRTLLERSVLLSFDTTFTFLQKIFTLVLPNTSFSMLTRAVNIIIEHLPEMKKGLIDTLDIVFVPKQIASQFVLAIALETSVVSAINSFMIFVLFLNILTKINDDILILLISF